MNDLSTLLAEFGVRQPFVLAQSFATALGPPKAAVRIEASGEQLFTGSLPARHSVGHYDVLFPLLDHVSQSIAGAHDDVAIGGGYLQTHAGKYVVRRAGYHHFVRRYFDDVTLDPSAPRHPHARALGLFHEHGWVAIHAAGHENSRSMRYAGRYPSWILPLLRASRATELGHAAGSLCDGIARIALLADKHIDALDRLPVFLTHTDYQSKNILTGPGNAAARRRVCIIDAESAHLQSRLFDLYFFLMGNDFGSTLDDFELFRTLLDSYFEHARGLTGDEARMLGFALQTKAADVAAWSAYQYAAEKTAGQATAHSPYESWYVQALRCIRFIDENQDAIRDCAEAHSA